MIVRQGLSSASRRVLNDPISLLFGSLNSHRDALGSTMQEPPAADRSSASTTYRTPLSACATN